jgi:hypothetical protein
MGEECGTYGRQYRCIQDFGRGDLMEREHFEDLGLDGRIILKMFFKNLDGGVDWIVLAEDMERWWAIVNAILKFLVP